MIRIKLTSIVYVGDIKSIFSKDDVALLSRDYVVYPVFIDLVGKNYLKLIKSAFFEILPGIVNSDISITWTADLHTAYVVLMSKLLRKPSVVIVGGYEVCDMPEINYGLQTTKFRGWVVRWVLRNATCIIVPSVAYQYKVKDLVNVTSKIVSNCSEIPNIPIEKKLPIVVTVAGQYGNADDFIALKGLFTYDAIAKSMPGILFYHIGYVDDNVKKRCGNITFIGNKDRNEIGDLLNKAKVYCQLSYTESFGVALLEAMQFGCVPVVTDADGMAELVRDNGYKIKYGDVKAGVESVKNALNDNKDRSKIISSMMEKYSKEQRKSSIMDIITDVINR